MESILTTLPSVGKYHLNGVQNPTLTFVVGNTYKFDISDASLGSHPFKFSESANGPTAYTTGVSYGATEVSITITSSTPTTLYYYCTAHNNMGNSISITAQPRETVDIKGSTVTIEGSKLEMVGPTDFSGAVVCEDTVVCQSTVQIDNTLTSKSGITLTGNLDTSTDEHKRIFTGVTNKTINIGGSNSTTSVNEMNIEGNITTNQNEHKSVFKGVVGKTITIGGSSTGAPSNNGLIDQSSDINGLTTNDFIYIYDNVGVLRAKIPISAISNGEASVVN